MVALPPAYHHQLFAGGGETVFHVLGTEKIELAAMNEAARLQSSGSLVYPAEPEAPTLF